MSYDLSNYSTSQQASINALISKGYGFPAPTILTDYVNGQPASAATFNARHEQLVAALSYLADATYDERLRAYNAEIVLDRRIARAHRAITAVSPNAIAEPFVGTLAPDGVSLTLTAGKAVVGGGYHEASSLDYAVTFTAGTPSLLVIRADGSAGVEAIGYADGNDGVVVGDWDGTAYVPRASYEVSMGRAYFDDDVDVFGTLSANYLTGEGSGVFGLDAANLEYGFVPVDRLPLATGESLGAVAIGANLTIDADGTLRMTAGNVTAALGYTPENTANKGIASGYVPLDATGKIPDEYMPAFAITETHVVASEVEQLALVAQKGDVAIRTDEANKSYILRGTNPAVFADWEVLNTVAYPVVSVNATGPLQVDTPTGAITISFQNQAINTILAGPASGGAGAPGFRAMVAADLPTVPVTKGGTGATTKTAGFDALSPMTTLGDLIVGGAAGTGTRLAPNATTTRKFLQQSGTTPATLWDTLQAGDLPLAAGATRGAVVVGTNLTNTNGTVSLTSTNVTAALGFTPLNEAGGTIAGNLLVSGILSAGSTPVALTNTLGKILDAALSTNVALKNVVNNFTAGQSISRLNAADTGFYVSVNGDSHARWITQAGGKFEWGPGGNTARDTFLYRDAVGSLKTDGTFTAQALVGDGIGLTNLAKATTDAFGVAQVGDGLGVTAGVISNADKGSSQAIFKGIANNAGTLQFSAASNTDAIQFAAGTGMSVAFDVANKRVTYANTGVTAFNTRTGAVTLTSGDVTTALGYTPVNPDASVNFTEAVTVDKAITKGVIFGTAASGSRLYSTGTGVDNVDITAILTGLTSGSGINITGTGHSREITNTGLLSATGSGPITATVTTGALAIGINDATGSAKGAVQIGTGLSVNAGVVSNADTGSSQAIFKTIANGAGTSQFVAGSNTDTLRFDATSGVAVAFDNATKKVTFSNTGVTSFNTRTGAVSLTSGDVTNALGYTPANVAGDTFTGAVNLAGNYNQQLIIGKVGQAGRIVFNRGNDGAAAGFVGYDSAGSMGVFRVEASGGSGVLVFSTGGSERARFLNGGTFLIGRTTDDGTSSAVQVNGYISASGFKGDGSGLTGFTSGQVTGALGFTPENIANKATANGYASLGADGKIPSAQLPSIAITETFVVASEAAMLALVAQRGDVAVRTDLNRTYILQTESPATLADWQEMLTPTDSVLSVNGMTGSVTLTTSNVTEGTNLYWTQARFNSAFGAKNTDGLAEGSSNLYYTQARFDTAFDAKTTADLTENTNLYYTQARFDTAFAAKLSSTTPQALGTATAGTGATAARVDHVHAMPTAAQVGALSTSATTSNVAEGSRLYYTQARFDSAYDARLSITDPAALGGSAVVGTGTTAARADHVHPYPTAAEVGALASTATTTDVLEGSRLYYTQARFDSAFAAKSTSNLAEGTNLYFTNARADARADARITATLASTTPSALGTAAVGTGTTLARADHVHQMPTAAQVGALPTGTTTSSIGEGTNLYYTQARFDTAFAAKSTSGLSEGTNLYYTQARFDSAFTAKTTTNLAEGDNLYWTQGRFDTAYAARLGAALGAASLDSSGKIPTSQLPALAVTDSFVVASQAEMLAITGQRGDIAIRTDLNRTFILQADDPTQLASWKELLTPTDTVLSVNGLTGAVTLTTSNIGEGSNLYYTQARFDAAFTAKSTSNLSEGTNLYYTDARADARVTARLASITPAALGTAAVGVSTTMARADHVHQVPTTSAVAEGTNLYYTDARADARIANKLSATAPAPLAATAAVGTGTTTARADHVHPLPTAAQVNALPDTGGTVDGDVLVNGKVTAEAIEVKAPSSTKKFTIEYNEVEDTLDFIFAAS